MSKATHSTDEDTILKIHICKTLTKFKRRRAAELKLVWSTFEDAVVGRSLRSQWWRETKELRGSLMYVEAFVVDDHNCS
jgi:hypothetical protein